MLGITAATLLPIDIQAADLCTGHKGLQTLRPELSCSHVELRIYPSPDGVLRAVVYPTSTGFSSQESIPCYHPSRGVRFNGTGDSSAA
jgi:hypothetical protein